MDVLNVSLVLGSENSSFERVKLWSMMHSMKFCRSSGENSGLSLMSTMRMELFSCNTSANDANRLASREQLDRLREVRLALRTARSSAQQTSCKTSGTPGFAIRCSM